MKVFEPWWSEQIVKPNIWRHTSMSLGYARDWIVYINISMFMYMYSVVPNDVTGYVMCNDKNKDTEPA